MHKVYDLSSRVFNNIKIILDYLLKRRSLSKRPLFFLHLPKTAGTSFISGITTAYGKQRIIKYYKGESPTSLIQAHLIDQPDYPEFYAQLKETRIMLYTGHRSLDPDGYCFPSIDILTFLRDPVKRVLSNYQHLVREYQYSESLEDHLNQDKFCNVQSRRIAPYPSELIGYVGITESYDRALKSINMNYRLKTPYRQQNVNKGSVNLTYSQEILKLIEQTNQADIDLYNKHTQLFEQRLLIEANNHVWCLGNIDTITPKSLSGVVYSADDDASISVQLLFEGKVVAETEANQLSQFYQRFNVPNNGQIKYAFKHLSGLPEFGHKDYKVQVKGSNQELFYYPRA